MSTTDGATGPETPDGGAVRRHVAVRRPPAVVVAGPPGCGKSTAGARLARLAGRHGLPLAVLDQDSMTGPLTRVVARQAGRPDDLDAPDVRALIREPTYEALLGVAADVMRSGVGCVLVAPFTAERRDPERWRALESRLRDGGAGRVVLVWVTCPPGILLGRLRARGAPRDRAKLADPGWLHTLDLAPPDVPHVPVDAAVPRAELDAQLTVALTKAGIRAST
jgi:predicted kinase